MNVSKKRKVIAELKKLEPSSWSGEALRVLEDAATEFAGQSEFSAASSVEDLIRLYEVRGERVRDGAIRARGISELLKSLATYPTEADIVIQPFLGPIKSVTAFWDREDRLVGCVTVLSEDAESGQRALVFANSRKKE